jgi:ribonuclease HI
MTPIIIRTEEAAKQYTLREGKGDLTQTTDLEVKLKNWPHPADMAAIIEVKEYDDQTIQIYTDGSKHEQGVGSGVAIFNGKELVTQLKYKLDNRCSNNQVEQLAIAKALEAIETIDIEENSPRTAAIITDSRITLDSIKNVNNHSYLIKEIRKRLSKLERSNWTVAFSWVKAHAGILGNELADQLAKAATRGKDKTISYSRIPMSTLYRELEEDTKLNGKKSGKKVQRQPKQNNSFRTYQTDSNRK